MFTRSDWMHLDFAAMSGLFPPKLSFVDLYLLFAVDTSLNVNDYFEKSCSGVSYVELLESISSKA